MTRPGFFFIDVVVVIDASTGLKKLNNWPTYPQLIVKGEFVGGLDVTQEMADNGELKQLLTTEL